MNRVRAASVADLFVRNRYVLLADVALIACGTFVAFALRFDLKFAQTRPEFVPFLIAVLVLKPTVFFWFGMYRRFWRYASLNDMLIVALAVSVASLCLAVISGIAVLSGFIEGFSRAVLSIDWLITLVVAASVRTAVRVIGESRGRSARGAEATQEKHVLVVGAGEAGALVVRELERNPHLGMRVVGFLDDDRRKHGKRIYGVLVLGAVSALEDSAKFSRVDEVVIAMPTATGAVVRAINERCQARGLPCRTMPGVFELLDGQVSISRLRQIEISDLLRRSLTTLRPGGDTSVHGRRVLITGAGGSIGTELCRQVARGAPKKLVMLGHGENTIFDAHTEIRRTFPGVHVFPVIADIRDQRRIARIMNRVKPAVVFHAAAHKHVPLMEHNPQEAVSNNIIGTKHVVDAAIAAGVDRLVMISTDKAVSPSSMMGASKRMAELIVSDAARRTGRGFVVVRFGNVLGSRGSVVPLFKQQIEQGGPVTVTDPQMRRFFMTIPEAVHLVVQAGGMGRGGELFVLNMGEPVRIVDLARDLIRLSGLKESEIPIAFTGLRPGEKIEEKLWEEGALVADTDHPEVLRIVEPDAPTQPDLAVSIEALRHALETDDVLELQKILVTCVGTFVPSLDRIEGADSRSTSSTGNQNAEAWEWRS